MNLNNLYMAIMRGDWLMSFEGLQTYAPLAYKLMTRGDELLINAEAATNVLAKTTASLGHIVDKTGARIRPDEKGRVDAPKDSVAIVNMTGPVMKYGDMCTYGAEEIAGALFAADRNPNIAYTIFKIDGPGGGVSALGPFLEFAKYKTKPVVGLVDQGYSLHYWALCAVCNHRMADNAVTSGVGSVGVMSQFVDNRAYLEKLGYKMHNIVPDESKDKNLAFELAMQGKYDMIKKEHLSPLAIKFQDAVRVASPNLKEASGVLTGKTFGADQALEYGMIDSIGGFGMAMQVGEMLVEQQNFKKRK